jgi:hypothetical protein
LCTRFFFLSLFLNLASFHLSPHAQAGTDGTDHGFRMTIENRAFCVSTARAQERRDKGSS